MISIKMVFINALLQFAMLQLDKDLRSMDFMFHNLQSNVGQIFPLLIQ